MTTVRAVGAFGRLMRGPYTVHGLRRTTCFCAIFVTAGGGLDVVSDSLSESASAVDQYQPWANADGSLKTIPGMSIRFSRSRYGSRCGLRLSEDDMECKGKGAGAGQLVPAVEDRVSYSLRLHMGHRDPK